MDGAVIPGCIVVETGPQVEKRLVWLTEEVQRGDVSCTVCRTQIYVVRGKRTVRVVGEGYSFIIISYRDVVELPDFDFFCFAYGRKSPERRTFPDILRSAGRIKCNIMYRKKEENRKMGEKGIG